MRARIVLTLLGLGVLGSVARADDPPPVFHEEGRKLSLGEIALKAARTPSSKRERRTWRDGSERVFIDGHYAIVRQGDNGSQTVTVLGSQWSKKTKGFIGQTEYTVPAGATKATFDRAVHSANDGNFTVGTLRFITAEKAPARPILAFVRGVLGLKKLRPFTQMVSVSHSDYDHSREKNAEPFKLRSDYQPTRHAPSMKSVRKTGVAAYKALKGK